MYTLYLYIAGEGMSVLTRRGVHRVEENSLRVCSAMSCTVWQRDWKTRSQGRVSEDSFSSEHERTCKRQWRLVYIAVIEACFKGEG